VRYPHERIPQRRRWTRSSAAERQPRDGLPRLARLDEAERVAELWLASRRASLPQIPPPAHSDAEVIDWFASVVLRSEEVWVIERDGGLVAMLVLADGSVEQLYVAPGCTGSGLGSRLIELAKSRAPILSLWTFEANVGARRFYERHGFHARERTDGENEERAPDVRYEWRSPGSPESPT
jgi:GNAT superfamily N-acetyltransferase